MDHSDPEKLDHSTSGADETPDGPPWKPTRASPGTIAILMAVCAVFVTLFMMFILRVF